MTSGDEKVLNRSSTSMLENGKYSMEQPRQNGIVRPLNLQDILLYQGKAECESALPLHSFAHYIGGRLEENTTVLLITLKKNALSAAVMMSSCGQFLVRALAFCVRAALQRSYPLS